MSPARPAAAALAILCALAARRDAAGPSPYPLDGYAYTGIRRLEAQRRVQAGELRGRRLPDGALLGRAEVRLRLAGVNDTFDIGPATPRDPYLQRGLERIFRPLDRQYSVALLDITDPTRPRYAALREAVAYSPGSVGKLVVLAGLFDQLARVRPDTAERARLLRETLVTADRFILTDEHVVPFADPERRTLFYRPLRVGDTFTLWEWVDHMVSPSSNAAASTVWKQVMLMRRFGRDYPAGPLADSLYFADTPRAELGDAAVHAVNDAIRAAGIGEDEMRQGSFFTHAAKRIVPGTSSRATPLGLLRFLVKLEQGRIVDRWSSLEMKRLLYVTRRRIRYAGVNDDVMMYAASLPKIAALLAAFERIEDGGLALTPRLRGDLVDMIRYSDNRAATRVIRALGFDYIAACLQERRYRLYDPGMGGGLWLGKAYDPAPAALRDPVAHLSHGATSRQAARFFVLLDRGLLVSPRRSREMLEILGDPGIEHKFVKGLKRHRPEARIYRKSGTWRTYHADAALVAADGRHRYAVAALVDDPDGGAILERLIVVIDDLVASEHAPAR